MKSIFKSLSLVVATFVAQSIFANGTTQELYCQKEGGYGIHFKGTTAHFHHFPEPTLPGGTGYSMNCVAVKNDPKVDFVCYRLGFDDTLELAVVSLANSKIVMPHLVFENCTR